MRRTSLLAAVLVALAALSMSPHEGQALGGTPTFRLTNTGTHGVELNLGFTSNGNIYYGGWDHIARSVDGGVSFAATTAQPTVPLAADRVLIVDPATNRVYVEDTTLGCGIVSWSDNGGRSWTANPLACGGGVTDHAKIAVGKRRTVADPSHRLYPSIVYVCANGLADTPCTESYDGGLTFGPSIPAGLVDPTHRTVTATCAFQGVPMASASGIVYQPKAQCGASVDQTANNGLSWTSSKVDPSSSGDAPSLAVAPSGALYFLWSKASWQPTLARSTDGGAHWREFPISAGLRSVVFPVVTAGPNGAVGIAFIGTPDNPAGWDGNPGNAPDSVHWYLYAAVVTDAASASPTINVTQVAAAPVNIGCLSKLGACGKANVGDYMDVKVSPDGHLAIAYMVNCPPGCTTAAQSDDDQGYLAYETGGPLLR